MLLRWIDVSGPARRGRKEGILSRNEATNWLLVCSSLVVMELLKSEGLRDEAPGDDGSDVLQCNARVGIRRYTYCITVYICLLLQSSPTACRVYVTVKLIKV